MARDLTAALRKTAISGNDKSPKRTSPDVIPAHCITAESSKILRSLRKTLSRTLDTQVCIREKIVSKVTQTRANDGKYEVAYVSLITRMRKVADYKCF